MFEVSGNSEVGNIGARNAEASRQKLKELGIPLLAEDTGLNYAKYRRIALRYRRILY